MGARQVYRSWHVTVSALFVSFFDGPMHVGQLVLHGPYDLVFRTR